MENTRFRALLKSLYETFGNTKCWAYPGYLQPNGYASVFVTYADGHRGRVMAHRLSYTMLVKEIPPGLVIDHLCRNRACLNPEHLEPVTQLENVRRGKGHGSEIYCPQGHLYAGDNMYISANGGRVCRQCQKDFQTRFRAENKEKTQAYDRARDKGKRSQRARETRAYKRLEDPSYTPPFIASQEIVDAIFELRKQGLTQQKIAAVTGVSQTLVSRVLRGVINPRHTHR